MSTNVNGFNSVGNKDVIELLIPFKAEYVSIARLTSSGIANRVGFDIETIEDIKVAVAEVCNKLVLKGSKTAQFFKVIFEVYPNKLKIVFNCDDKDVKCIFDDDSDGLGVSIITAFMDEVEFCTDNSYLMSMSKILEVNK